MQLEKACPRREMRCGYFYPPLWCPPLLDHQRHSNFWLEAIGDWFFPLPRFVPPRTRPPAIPLRRRRRKWVCFLLFLPEVSAGYSLLFTSFDDLRGQLILMVLLYWKSVSFSLLDFQPSQMYLFTEPTWLVVFCIITESFSHLSVPALQFGLRVSVYDHLLSVMFYLFPNDLRNRRSRSSLHICFLGQRLLFLWIFENGLASMPSTFVLKMIHVDFLVWFARQYEAVRGLQWLENLSQSSLGHSFLVGLLTRHFFYHICRILCLFCFFWYTNCIERRSRCLCFSC